MHRHRTVLWAAITAALFLAGLAGHLVADDGDSRLGWRPPAVETITTPGPTPDVVVDADGQLEERELEKADAGTGPGSHEDLADEQPPGAPPAAAERVAETPTAGLTAPRPLGGAQIYSCKYRPVRNQSSRGGVRIELAALHYAVIRNVPGWADIDLLWRLFDDPSFSASSTYVMDFEGNCLQLMRESAKPWTQGAFNPVTVSIEIIAYGTESKAEWKAAPLIKNGLLAALWADVLKRNGLPPRLVDPIGCGVQEAGWTDHDALECQNTHHDVKPNFPYGLFQSQLERFYYMDDLVPVWQVRADGELLHQERQRPDAKRSAYRRTVLWMRGAGSDKIRAAEREHGHVTVRKTKVPRAA